jgi:hypothetical protein
MLIWEKGIFVLEAHSTLYVPKTIGTWSIVMGTQTTTKLSMYCTNYHHTNHNMETYRSKKEEPTIVVIKGTTTNKPPRPLNYP